MDSLFLSSDNLGHFWLDPVQLPQIPLKQNRKNKTQQFS